MVQDNTNITTDQFCSDTYFSSVCAQKDKLIVSGGFKKSPFLKKSVSDVHVYCFITKEWSSLPDLPCPRNRHASSIIKHNLYILAGVNKEQEGINLLLTEVHVLNLNTRSWTKAKDLPYGVDSPGVVVFEEKMYVIGGGNFNILSSNRIIKYIPHTDTWDDCQTMPKFRYILSTLPWLYRRWSLCWHSTTSLCTTLHKTNGASSLHQLYHQKLCHGTPQWRYLACNGWLWEGYGKTKLPTTDLRHPQQEVECAGNEDAYSSHPSFAFVMQLPGKSSSLIEISGIWQS